jgi:hypothetical protein
MMSESKKSRPKDVTDTTKVKYAIDFIEELSWLLESKKKLKLSEIPEILRNQSSGTNSISGAAKYVSPNPNIHNLIGVLPLLFKDTKLFTKNDEIVAFAKEVLGIEISRSDKRSRYELIGRIVCECSDLNDKTLEILVDALAILTGSNDGIEKVVKQKSEVGFSWNNMIRKIAGR